MFSGYPMPFRIGAFSPGKTGSQVLRTSTPITTSAADSFTSVSVTSRHDFPSGPGAPTTIVAVTVRPSGATAADSMPYHRA
ncbi:hypothetical protein [Nonomuraea sp. NPDC003804]|uniref:hypothetical protein n=1 Tax=Nonomuraea sp. NPDC003804 TaxID=3154547 RepID=UPI0033AA561E